MSSLIKSLLTKHKNIGVASHDSGGANIITSLINNFSDIQFVLYTNGPATKIFNNDNVTFVNSRQDLLKNLDLLILGTGSTNFEKNILKEAVSNKIYTVSILDHFVNYKNRFQIEDKFVFPNLCFVADQHAYEIALKELHPFKEIHICENYYINSLKSSLMCAENNSSKKVLYVLENLDENWGDEPPWLMAFKNFYYNFFKKNSSLDSIIVRPHPKDNIEEYKELKKYKEVIFDQNTSQLASLSAVQIVVGIESYFLYMAKELGFEVFTSLPKEIRSPRLPKNTCKAID